MNNLVKFYAIEGKAKNDEGDLNVYYYHHELPFALSRVIGFVVYDSPGRSEIVSVWGKNTIRIEAIKNDREINLLKVQVAYI